MDWTLFYSQVSTGLGMLLAGAVVVFIRYGLRWMSEQKNAVLHTVGELAYKEIEANIPGIEGGKKLTMALQATKQRLQRYPFLRNIDDQAIVNAIQTAWQQNEGQYKAIRDGNVASTSASITPTPSATPQ